MQQVGHKTQITVRAMQETITHTRRWKVKTKSQWTTQNSQDDAAAKASAIRKSVVHSSDLSRWIRTIPTRQHPKLGQAHGAHMDHHSTQRATGMPSKRFLFANTITAIADIMSSDRDQEFCALGGWCRTPHSPVQS